MTDGVFDCDVDALGRSVWVAAAAAGLGRTGDAQVDAALVEVLTACGRPAAPLPAEMAAGLQSQIHRAARLAAGALPSWGDLEDSVLIGQGQASSLAGMILAVEVVPALPGLAAALARPNACFLDVGVGIGALCCAALQRLPEVRAVGIDVLPRAIGLARTTVHAAGLEDRVELRLQSVAEVTEVEAYDLAWVPLPFVPQRDVDAGIPRLLRALRPGGWLVAAGNHEPGDRLADALGRLHGLLTGGSGIPPSQLRARLEEAGFTEVSSRRPPWPAPTLTTARRPPG